MTTIHVTTDHADDCDCRCPSKVTVEQDAPKWEDGGRRQFATGGVVQDPGNTDDVKMLGLSDCGPVIPASEVRRLGLASLECLRLCATGNPFARASVL